NSNIQIPEEEGVKHAFGRFPVLFKKEDKFKMHRMLLSRGIETALNYPYICPNTVFMKKYKTCRYPNAEKAARHTIVLPFHTYLKENDVLKVAETIKGLI
ncbi:MAG: DegT/DnrJ/EryC1/StrS family aminotransferase, partial [Nanoarchaeota archaeon]|nr:DegT/DnrJ/EryC1/StrS family aminotransferase [Nanoarchaeota archaeon]